MMTTVLFSVLASAAMQPPPGPPVLAPAPAIRARTNLADYFSDSWYPPEALRNREEGTVRFEVQVRADGRAGACRVTVSSGSSALDDSTCAIMMERGRFTPARDAEGRAVPDRFTARIH